MVKKSQTLHIPFDEFQYIGGAPTFLRNLRAYLDTHHIPCHPSLDAASVLFFPTSFYLSRVQRFKQRGGYVVQRLDGIYYPSKHGETYQTFNHDAKIIYQDYADTVIFQSRYSQAQCFEMFGKREHFQIVINGVDKSIFYPGEPEKHQNPGRTFRLITTGRFRNRDMIEPVVNALDALQSEFDVELTVIGPITEPSLSSYFQRPYIRHIAQLSLHEIADELRGNDLFLYSHLNPPCPNSVVEAISCGLPVVGFDSGAMSELCYFSKDLLAYVSEDLFQRYEDFHADKLSEKIRLALQNYDQYRERALAHSHLYSFEECGKQYVSVLQHYLHKRRKLMPSLVFQIQQFFKKVRHLPSSLKYRTLKRLVLSSNSLVHYLLLSLDRKQFVSVVFHAIHDKSSSLAADDALKCLFELEKRLYNLEGQEAIRYGNGLHTKHRHLKSHDFFVQRIEPGSRVIDVGCGNGALAYDIATQVEQVSVYGLDILPANIEQAQQQFSAENIHFVCGNALIDIPEAEFDVIVLSNVLEDLEQRVEFLQSLQQRCNPKKFLVRVPLFERDWRARLKQELGVDDRLDPIHEIEFPQEKFTEEITQAGLRIRSIQFNWGEALSELVTGEPR